ncbi:hypothetical protein Tco_1389176 [Tanacetum coccineum]
MNVTRSDTYRSDLKRLPMYSAYPNPRGFIYQNKDKKNKLMCIDELHKFSDGTLNDVRTALDDILKRIGIRIYHRHMGKSYKAVRHRYSNPMIQPEPEGSTQGYPLVSIEVLRYDTKGEKMRIGNNADCDGANTGTNPTRVQRIILVILPEHPSDTQVFTVKMEILLELTSNKLMVVIRTASEAAKPCQGDSSELYLITGSIYTDQRGIVVLPMIGAADSR